MRLFINGQEVTATEIRITGVTTSPAPDPVPDPEPTPTPPPAPDQPCGPVPAGVYVGSPIDLANPGSATRQPLGSGEIRSRQILTTSDPNLAGQFAFGSVTGTTGVQRTAWISRCPGGDPIDSRAEAKGGESTNLHWSQSPQRGKSTLTPGQTYYLNVRNGTGRTGPTTCPRGGCDVWFTVYTTG